MANNDTLLQYCAAITAILAIGYVLVITNPPPSLTRYDNVENRFVYGDLSSLNAMQEHGWVILVFAGIFGLLSAFIGMMTAFIHEDIEKNDFHLISFIIVIFMGILLVPYYGSLLAVVVLPIGLLAYYGTLIYFSPKFREKFRHLRLVFIILLVLYAILAVLLTLFLLGLLHLEEFVTVFPCVITVYSLIANIVLISYLLRLIIGKFLEKRRKIKKNNR